MGLQLELTGGVFLKKKKIDYLCAQFALAHKKSEKKPPLCENLQKQAKITKNRGN